MVREVFVIVNLANGESLSFAPSDTIEVHGKEDLTGISEEVVLLGTEEGVGE